MSARAMLAWAGRIAAGLAMLVVLAVAVVWLWGGAIIARSYPVEDRGFRVADHAVDLERGERFARITGCMDGCHGKGAEGRVFFEAPLVVSLVAPNLTTLEHRYSDAEIEALVRQGVRPDGQSLWAMPSGAFARLTDGDLASILAYLRSVPDSDNEPGRSTYSIVGRFEVIRAEMIRPEAEKAEGIEPATTLAGPEARGDYLATLACAECHGADLGGNPGFSPSLEIAKSYDLPRFTRLLREGVALGDREVGLMSEVARGRFSHFTDDEIGALHAYLSQR